MGCVIGRHKRMASADKEGDDDEVMIYEDGASCTENNNNYIDDKINFNINDSIVQEEE